MDKQAFYNTLNSIPQFNNYGEKVTVVGATKTVNVETINYAAELGLLHVGENKVQELLEKYDNYPPCTLHFIGHLQTNKVKQVVGKVELIQSVDSKKLATEINKQAQKLGIVQQILIQVNISKEPQKHGFLPEEGLSSYQFIKELKHVKVRGFMAMLAKSENENKISALCLQMREIYDIIAKDDKYFNILSMGMSADFKIAVKNGSNMVRLGSYLFGKRN